MAASPEAQLKSLQVDLDDLPAEVRERLVARANARAGRLAIGRYVITGELGRGGMGVVYDAWDPRIDRRVAVKTVEPDLIPDEGEREEVIERFIREIKMVGKLHHPSIVTLFDYGEEPELKKGDDPYAHGRTYYYVMEYLEGRSLSKILREKKQLPDLEAVQIGLDVADALRVAHARGIIHRDIKPSNILIRGGRAVLLDFGIAKTNQAALTRQGQILGTPTYLAPERLREKEDGLDGRADIFSLGVLLYTMLVGEAPFQGDNVYDLLDNIAKQTHNRLSRSTQGGVLLSRTIDRMLAKKPQDRFGSAEEVVAALTQVRGLLGSSTPDVSDLGAGGAVLVAEPMTDAATEVATPSGALPVPMPEVLRPGDPSGTSPEVALGRSTRRIDVGPSHEPEAPWDLDGTQAETPTLDTGMHDEEEAVDTNAGGTIPSRRVNNGGGVTLRASASMQLEPVRAPRPALGPAPAIPAIGELRAAPRRLASLAGEEETLADTGGGDRHEAMTASEVRLPDGVLTEPAPPRGPTVSQRSRRRIEASLVDEDEVVVRPAALDGLHPDDMPTQGGGKKQAGALAIAPPAPRPGDPLETDIVRPRRIGPARDPADPPKETPKDAAAVRRQQEREALAGIDRPTHSAPPPPAAAPSAAVARRTIARTGSGRHEPPPTPEIRVTGTDLDSPGARAARVRMRWTVAILAGAVVAVVVGIVAGRSQSPSSAAASAAPSGPAPAPRVLVGDPRTPDPVTEAVAPRTPAEIMADAQRAFAEQRFPEADRLYSRALEATSDGSELQAKALVARARVLIAMSESERAEKLLRKVIEVRSDGNELKDARTLLEAMGKDPGRPRPPPRASAAPAASASPRPTEPPPPAPKPIEDPELLRLTPDEQCKTLIRRFLDDPQGGIAALEALASRSPATPCVYKQLGTFYRRVGDDRAAIDAYKRYLQLDPNAADRASVQSRIDAIAGRMGP